MMTSFRGGVCNAALLLAVIALGGCKEAEVIQTVVRIDLSPCLGEVQGRTIERDGGIEAVASNCRDQLDTAIDTNSAVNACLAVRLTQEGAVTARVAYNWDRGLLGPPLNDVEIPPGEEVEAMLFFLTQGGGPEVCDALDIGTECTADANCALRLSQESATPAANGSTVIDFTSVSGSQSVCNHQQGETLSEETVEVCDSLDNDCDRKIDEGFTTGDTALGTQCEVGVGACRVAGVLVCNDAGDGVVCDATPGTPAAAELCDDNAGIDDDCDGRMDELADCFSCTTDDDCQMPTLHPNGPQCVGGVCRRCDPSDHEGCRTDQLCCGADDAIACQDLSLDECTACENDSVEAGANRAARFPGGCALNSTDPEGCVDRECICGATGACEDPFPVCVEGTCVKCQIDAHCGPVMDDQGQMRRQLCCDSQCQIEGVTRDPNTFEVESPGPGCGSCATPENDTRCDIRAADRCAAGTCRCGADDPCRGESAVCYDGQCVECVVNSDCGDDGICDFELKTCIECTISGDCDGQQQCVDQECVECDAQSLLGCRRSDAAPFCSGGQCDNCNGDADCTRIPAIEAEDEALVRCVSAGDFTDADDEGTCKACDPNDNRGCGAEAPFCNGDTFTCEPCAVDAHCRRGGGDAQQLTCVQNGPLAGRCSGCDTNTHAGCAPDGAAPFCQAQNGVNSCRGCADDGECSRVPDALGQCVLGSCVECDTEDHAGCAEGGAAPICANSECRACRDDDECARRPGDRNQCVNGRCEVCDNDPILNSPGCDAGSDTPICGADATCVACTNNAECRRGLPAGAPNACDRARGRCTGCDPQTNAGCDPSGQAPICDAEGVCRSCADEGDQINALGDRECAAASGNTLTQCVLGVCESCDPGNHDGCDEAGAQPFCRNGVCDSCNIDLECIRRPGDRDQCVSGLCKECDAADDEGCNPFSDTPICSAEDACTACGDDQACADNPVAPGDICVQQAANAGLCRSCDPGDNAGCAPRSAQPVCDGDGLACRGCLSNAECQGVDGALGQQCVGGSCRQCNPSTHAGCAEGDARPVCAANFTCVACAEDATCIAQLGDRDECVGGRCQLCDNRNGQGNAGCDDPANPVCQNNNACGPCQNDAQCRRGGDAPPNLECFNGLCVECDPEQGNAGCEADGFRPICDRQTLTCRGCGDDSECGVNPDLTQCLLGSCLACDATDHAGCTEAGSTPICDGDACRACASDNECATRPGNLDQCIAQGRRAGSCALCDPLDNAGCDGGSPVCDAGECRPCAGNAECNPGGGNQFTCTNGRCTGCNPADHDGCAANSATPFCDQQTESCRPCLSDAECGAVPGADGQCVLGRCVECDPFDNAGCNADGATPVCRNNVCEACDVDLECAIIDPDDGQCVNGRCRTCDPSAGEDNAGCTEPTASFCSAPANFSCVTCSLDDQCAEDLLCTGERCAQCDPSNNRGCDANGFQPICDGDQFLCRGCSGDAECDGGECVNGACVECDPVDNAGCDSGQNSARPICGLDRQCTACSADAECILLGIGRNECVNGSCKFCDSTDDSGCTDPAAPVCRNNDNSCRGCNNDGECNGALVCVGGSCEGCDPADPITCNAATPICDPTTQVCRACDNSAECGGQECVSGRCFDCSPTTHAGCDPLGAEPFCGGANNTCRGCLTDAECGVLGADRTQCIDGTCRACDPRDGQGSAGCDDPAEPTCGGDFQCRGCTGDNECNTGVCIVDPASAINGQCRTCDPTAGESNRGCDLASQLICDGADFTCRGCENDGECQDGEGFDFCVGGNCGACDPIQREGCDRASASPICDQGGLSCRPCQGDAECALLGDGAGGNDARPQCVEGRCQACDTVDNAGCGGNTPVCDNGSCVPCDDATAPCDGDRQCLNGSCVGCNPANNAGCDDPANPVCGDNGCRPCINDNECNGGQCVNNRCEECDPNEGVGCGINQRCCEQDDQILCVNYDLVGNCVSCNEGCNADRADSCAGGSCRCGLNAACDEGEFCLVTPGGNGIADCVECRDHTDCSGTTPRCKGGICMGCTQDGGCPYGGAGGNICVQAGALLGACGDCDPDDNQGCSPDSDAPRCDGDTAVCEGCDDNAFCAGNAQGQACLGNGACGCDQASDCVDALSGCNLGVCGACDADAQCAAGRLCCDGDCQAQGENQCGACGQACDDRSDACVDGACACTAAGMAMPCAGNLVCADGGCVECSLPDFECGEGFNCVNNNCVEQ